MSDELELNLVFSAPKAKEPTERVIKRAEVRPGIKERRELKEERVPCES